MCLSFHKDSIRSEINKHIIERLNQKDVIWDWSGLSRNPVITWEIVISFPDKPWNWCELSRNSNITSDIVIALPDKPWDWYGISKNVNIVWDIVQTNPDKPWNWLRLSTNRHMLLSSKDLCNIIKRHRAAKVVQKKWRHVVTNPSYTVCKRRLLREFYDMVQ